MSEYPRPLPVVNDLNRPHWEGAREGEYRIQRCRSCGHMWFPPLPNCTRCLSTDYQWHATRGRGTVYSFIRYHRAWHPGFQEELPYNVAVVELAEGVRVISNIVGLADEAQLRVGMPVEVVFDRVSEEVTIPRFRPARV